MKKTHKLKVWQKNKSKSIDLNINKIAVVLVSIKFDYAIITRKFRQTSIFDE